MSRSETRELDAMLNNTLTIFIDNTIEKTVKFVGWGALVLIVASFVFYTRMHDGNHSATINFLPFLFGAIALPWLVFLRIKGAWEQAEEHLIGGLNILIVGIVAVIPMFYLFPMGVFGSVFMVAFIYAALRHMKKGNEAMFKVRNTAAP